MNVYCYKTYVHYSDDELVHDMKLFLLFHLIYMNLCMAVYFVIIFKINARTCQLDPNNNSLNTLTYL